jgi:glycosyltransferase involved in cell wall biosynthesis
MKMRHGKTAVYTILKNEKQYIEKWLYYGSFYDYRVLLDTGSTDGSWELLQEAAKSDPKLIIEQKVFTPWRFDVARRHNLAMVPKDVVWCLSPDLDEYYSKNTLSEIEKIISAVPDVTCIASDRLDIYSDVVRVGPPNFIPTNKIHRRHDYTWVQPIYEHISWLHKDVYERELYSEDIFLVHDQDFKKKERSELYVKMMREECAANPQNTWVLWYLIYHFYKSGNLTEYVPAVCDYLKYDKNPKDKRYTDLKNDLMKLYQNEDSLTFEQRQMIISALQLAMKK